ncbi:MAG: hypothetical protein KC501_26735 [Myxococcales bacterium]|nr:hypothetical protein [Myxococcales bacterium]
MRALLGVIVGTVVATTGCRGDDTGADGSTTDRGSTTGSTAADDTATSTGSEEATGLTVLVTAELHPAVAEFVELMPASDISVLESDDPWTTAATQAGVVIAVELGDPCEECYQLSSQDTRFRVRGGDLLGAQYGLAHAMEALGVRFFAPGSTLVPPSWPEAAAGVVLPDSQWEPDIAERGVQLHTLHPIEGLYAFWLPGEDNLEQARVIADWYVKQRADLLQWVALEDIMLDPAVEGAWRDHSSALLEILHARGLRAGVGIQLFGSGNLQRAFDLLDGELDEAGQRDAMTERLGLLLDGLPFDHVTISFGEFFGASADEFLASLDLFGEVLQEVAPGTTMSSVVHVGNYEDIYVDYMGESYIFYLLAQFADPAIVPWVHTVMYYNLYEDAGGAYLHDEFDAHRELLLSRLEGGQDVGYFPETAYWIAFDDSVPTYLPLYLLSRFIDLDQTRTRAEAGGFPMLQRHVLFSTGYEWGYWQNDYASLRMSYTIPEGIDAPITEMLAPLPGGDVLAQAVVALAQAQHDALIEARGAAYLAGRDGIIDVGDLGGVLSQPDRPSFAEILAMTPQERVAIADGPLAALAQLATATEDALAQVQPLEAGPWRDEIVDGIEIDALRTRFALAVFGAAVAAAEGQDPAPMRADAEARLEQARAVVARRHAALWSPIPQLLLESWDNPTLYPYGYLEKADTLCYWERELVELGNALDGTNSAVPACIELAPGA